jgi:riboflavin kinase/FMN adenylyltransferase
MESPVGIERTIAELARHRPARDTLLSVGVFDGVHLGHQHLIGRLVEEASARGCLSGVVTFSKHPKSVLSPDGNLARLTTVGERTSLLKSLGVDLVVSLSFTTDLAALGARQFVLLLVEHLRMRGLVVGPDFALGRGREGDFDALRTLGDELGFTVEMEYPVTVDGSIVSSTAVRSAIARGDMARTTKLLGRRFRLSGTVEGGRERGHQLGYPTANLRMDEQQALPLYGVYATISYLHGGAYASVTNIGLRPTFDDTGRTVEVFLIDFDGDIYGEEVTIELVERLRGEVKFGSGEELATQIGKDVEQARALLKETLASVAKDG